MPQINYQLVRKISTSTVFGNKTAVREFASEEKIASGPGVGSPTGKPRTLYRVYGIATGTRTGKSKFDDKEEPQEWVALMGSFQAENNRGEIYRAAQCFLPGYIVDGIAAKLSDETKQVRFAYDIVASYNPKSVTEYEYSAIPLLDLEEDDPLLALGAQTGAFKSVNAEPAKPQIADGRKTK